MKKRIHLKCYQRHQTYDKKWIWRTWKC